MIPPKKIPDDLLRQKAESTALPPIDLPSEYLSERKSNSLNDSYENDNEELEQSPTMNLSINPAKRPKTSEEIAASQEIDRIFAMQKLTTWQTLGLADVENDATHWRLKKLIEARKKFKSGLRIYRVLSKIGGISVNKVYLLSIHIALLSAVLYPTASEELYDERNWVFTRYYSVSWPTTIHAFFIETIGVCTVLLCIRLIARHPRLCANSLNILSKIFR
jgi:hypothetical protein